MSGADIGGLEEVKQRIREAVELPFKEPEALRRLGVMPPRGVPVARVWSWVGTLCFAASIACTRAEHSFINATTSPWSMPDTRGWLR